MFIIFKIEKLIVKLIAKVLLNLRFISSKKQTYITVGSTSEWIYVYYVHTDYTKQWISDKTWKSGRSQRVPTTWHKHKVPGFYNWADCKSFANKPCTRNAWYTCVDRRLSSRPNFIKVKIIWSQEIQEELFNISLGGVLNLGKS